MHADASTSPCNNKALWKQVLDITARMDGPSETEDRWEHWLVHLLWAVSVRTSMLGEVALGDSPLTLAGLGMLENVDARPGITIAEISRRAPQTQQALSQIVARLERLGFIERRLADRGQGRGVALHLTSAGAGARAKAHDAIEAFESELVDALGADRHRRVVRLLEQMREIVGELEPARIAPPTTGPA
jgi:DNA-binding MarR family transcriptional regulator